MNPLHILIVDDESAIVKAIASFLTRRGDRCETALNGESALALIRDHDFDIVLADLTMPLIDGLELTRRVKALRPQTVCIIMSGMGTRLDVIAALQIGVFDFLDKPFAELAVVSMVIERAGASRRLVRERDALLADLKNQNTKLETSLTRLHTAYSQLRQQEATLASDLRQAQRVQRKLLPAAFPVLEGFDLFGYFSPCERLGGDFFGVVPLSDGRLAVYLLDVAGHGVSAAMITTILRELLQPRRLLPARQETLGNPEKALAFLNHALLEEAFQPPILVTMVYAVIDAKSGTLTVASAGHPRPLIVDGSHTPLLPVEGPVLGLEHPGAFTTATLTLQPGDAVLLYSDGVSEARYEGGPEFTPARLGLALNSQRGQSAAVIGQAINEALRGHLGGHTPSDDMTFIVINRLLASAPSAPHTVNPHGALAADSVKVEFTSHQPELNPTKTGGITGGWSAATCVIHLARLATWQVTPAMRGLLATADAEGTGPIHVELAACHALDSTMLGLLYQFAKKLILHRPCHRVRSQLHEMGISEHFQISEAPAPEIDTPITVSLEASRAACSELILSAHEALMAASEDNRRRFQDVTNAITAEKS